MVIKYVNVRTNEHMKWRKSFLGHYNFNIHLRKKRNNGGRQSEVKQSTSYIPDVQITVLLRSVVQEVFLRSIVARIGRNQDTFCPNDACFEHNFSFFTEYELTARIFLHTAVQKFTLNNITMLAACVSEIWRLVQITVASKKNFEAISICLKWFLALASKEPLCSQ